MGHSASHPSWNRTRSPLEQDIPPESDHAVLPRDLGWHPCPLWHQSVHLPGHLRVHILCHPVLWLCGPVLHHGRDTVAQGPAAVPPAAGDSRVPLLLLSRAAAPPTLLQALPQDAPRADSSNCHGRCLCSPSGARGEQLVPCCSWAHAAEMPCCDSLDVVRLCCRLHCHHSLGLPPSMDDVPRVP